MSSDETTVAKPSSVPYALSAAAIIAVVWIWFVLEKYAGATLKGRRVIHGDETPIWFFVVVSVTTLLGAFVVYRRAVGFASRAVHATAIVEAIGAMRVKGMRDITYSYKFGERSYKKKRSVHDMLLGGVSCGDEIAIFVDSAKPANSRLPGEVDLA